MVWMCGVVAAQVLLIMAEELGKFVPLVGGPEHATVLLAPLEALCMVEETVVRDKAVEALNLVTAQLPPAAIAGQLMPLVQVPLPLPPFPPSHGLPLPPLSRPHTRIHTCASNATGGHQKERIVGSEISTLAVASRMNMRSLSTASTGNQHTQGLSCRLPELTQRHETTWTKYRSALMLNWTVTSAVPPQML